MQRQTTRRDLKSINASQGNGELTFTQFHFAGTAHAQERILA